MYDNEKSATVIFFLAVSLVRFIDSNECVMMCNDPTKVTRSEHVWIIFIKHRWFFVTGTRYLQF